MLGSMIGMLGGLGGAAFKMGTGIYQNILAGQIHPQDVTYQTSPYAQAQYGLAQQLYNGRMAGAANEERNLMANEGSTIGNINRNATSSSQALALATGAQGQTNQQLGQLGIQEAQNRQAMLGNLNQATGAMTAEHEKVYQDQLRKYQQDVQAKAALRGAGLNNMFGSMGELAGAGMMGAMNGGMYGSSQPLRSTHAGIPGMATNPYIPNTGNIPLPEQGSIYNQMPQFYPLNR